VTGAPAGALTAAEREATLTPSRGPQEPVDLLLRDLRASRDGLAAREAARRLVAYGPNELLLRE